MTAATPWEPDDLALVLARLYVGDATAGRVVFLRFARRMIELAERNLATWLRHKVDPEDIVQSVFRSFLTNCPKADWQFADWNGLWELLALMTVRKCATKATHYNRQRRRMSLEKTLADEPLPSETEPTPDEIVAFTDLLAALLHSLDQRGQAIVTLTLAGFTAGEVAEQVGCSRRTVFRTFNRAEAILRTLGVQPDAVRNSDAGPPHDRSGP